MTLKILEYAALLGRDNLVAIQRSVDTWLKGLSVEERPMEMAPDTRIIHRVIDEDLNNIPPETVVGQLPQSVWHLRKDYEHIKELANSRKPSSEAIPKGVPHIVDESHSKAILFDKGLFTTSDNIMNERELRDFLLGLEVNRRYRSLEYLKVARFWEFIELDGNKYTHPEARQFQNNLASVLEDLVLFLNDQFSADAKVKRKEDLECRLDPAGLRYLRDDNAKAKKIAEVENQLDEHIKAARDTYKAYRAGIRDRLYT